MTQERPLEGLRVVEMGQLLAGPFAGTVMGYFGAEVGWRDFATVSHPRRGSTRVL